MFANSRYLTINIANNIPVDLQSFMWSLIDRKSEAQQPLDYLQVFTLYKLNNRIMLVHSQEQPFFKDSYIYKGKIEAFQKIFVIDDGTYSTMMLASDY